MKKTLVVSLMVFTLTPLFAQRHARIPLITDFDCIVERTQARERSSSSWIQHLSTLEKQFVGLKSQYDWDRLPVQERITLGYAQQQKYAQRILELQKQINQNTVLKKYTFVAPQPDDLANLSSNRFATLQTFLKKSMAKDPTLTRVVQVRPFTLALHLGKTAYEALEIWIDVPSHKIYLMSNNFYTTAESRYSPHLF